MIDFGSIGATFRAEAEKAKHKTFAFAVILVLAHLLDIRPSEVDGLGFKVAFKDPVIVYSAIALLFGYNFSRFLSESDKSDALSPLVVAPRRMRAYLRATRRTHYSQKASRKTKLTPKLHKSGARQFIIFSNVMLLPYRVIAVLFVLTAIPFMVMDLWGLATLVWTQSPIVSELANLVTEW